MKEHVWTFRPRYDEVDAMGIVHHRNYFAYFEVGRTEYMRALGFAYTELERKGFRLVVTELGATYRAGAAYDEELRIRTRVTDLATASLRFEYTVENASGRILVKGFTILACLGTNLRPTRLPHDVTALLHSHSSGSKNSESRTQNPEVTPPPSPSPRGREGVGDSIPGSGF